VREFFASMGIDGSGAAEGSRSAEVAELRDQMSSMAEEFSGLQAALKEAEGRVDSLALERDEYRDRVASLQERVVGLQGARDQERFARMVVDEFSHLPGEADNLAGHLRWLYSADTDEGQPHAAYFAELLKKADGQFESAFNAKNAARVSVGASKLDQFEAAAAQYQADHPEVDYAEAMEAVGRAQPELYQAYLDELRGGAS
jgi:TolA-binding protein